MSLQNTYDTVIIVREHIHTGKQEVYEASSLFDLVRKHLAGDTSGEYYQDEDGNFISDSSDEIILSHDDYDIEHIAIDDYRYYNQKQYGDYIKEIEDVILGNFTTIYCHQCIHRDGIHGCKECDTKRMYWQVSREYANRVANEVAIKLDKYIQDTEKQGG